ncbi:MAG: class I SAM-dependent methyltransferase [Actinoplanes sp.]
MRIPRRQIAVLAGVGSLGAAAAGTALTGRAGTALALVAVLVTTGLGGLVLLARRLTGLQAANRKAQSDLKARQDKQHRRVIGTLDEILRKTDRHRELLDGLTSAQKSAPHRTDLLLRAQTREVEALAQLFGGFTPRAPMPSSGGFALNPTDLLDLLHLIRTRRPRLVLELGSGTSSVWIAYALEQLGGRLVSLDHDPGYAARTREALAAHGLTGVAEVRDAPLRPVDLDGRSFPWYDTAALTDLDGVDLLLIDGPPAKTGPDARYPAMRVLEDRLADAATVVFDDANREDEQAAMRRWVETIEGLTPEGETLGRHAVLSYRRIVRQFSKAQ